MAFAEVVPPEYRADFSLLGCRGIMGVFLPRVSGFELTISVTFKLYDDFRENSWSSLTIKRINSRIPMAIINYKIYGGHCYWGLRDLDCMVRWYLWAHNRIGVGSGVGAGPARTAGASTGHFRDRIGAVCTIAKRSDHEIRRENRYYLLSIGNRHCRQNRNGRSGMVTRERGPHSLPITPRS